jgi:acetylornithine/N-succinyldiaminopimelate aminotransferase
LNQREIFLRHVAQTSEEPFSGVNIDIVKAEGIFLHDRNGKIYTDLISGISVSSIGHCHPEVVKAVHEQSQKYMHLMVYGEFNQQPQAEYAKALTALLPASLDSVFFTTGGSEATEGAIKLVKRVTGRTEIISFTNAYHGSTQGALSLMGSEIYKNSFRPLVPGVKILEFNNTSQLDQITESTAAVIIEPVQGEAGIKPANTDFLQALSLRCKNTGTLLIFDEIQTGFGRTGSLFAFQKYNVVPDILLIAKGMGGGMPIGAFVSSYTLMSTLTHDPVLGHINTFGGNAVCVAAALATLRVISANDLSARALKIERMIREQLVHPLIKEVRVNGALGAVEFENEELNMRVIKECIGQGIITDWFLFCTTAMRIAPPLTITDNELKAAISTILRSLDAVSGSDSTNA